MQREAQKFRLCEPGSSGHRGEDTAPALGHKIGRLKLLIVQIPELRDLNSAQSCCRAIAGRARTAVSPLRCPTANPITSFC